MKKAISILAVIAVLSLCACSNIAKDANATSETDTTYAVKDGDTKISGEVTAIVGNKVTLALGTVSEGKGGKRGEGFTGERPEGMSEPNGMQRPDGEGFTGDAGSGERPEMPSGANGGNMPGNGGERPEGMSGFDGMERPSEGGSGGFGGGRSSGTIVKNGKTADYTLPVGMTISGASKSDADYSSVTVGMILTLTLNADGEVVAAEVV